MYVIKRPACDVCLSKVFGNDSQRAQRIREIETTVLQLPPPRPYVKNMFTWILQDLPRQTPHFLHLIASTEVQVETATDAIESQQ